jgi:hypothetical protein
MATDTQNGFVSQRSRKHINLWRTLPPSIVKGKNTQNSNSNRSFKGGIDPKVHTSLQYNGS